MAPHDGGIAVGLCLERDDNEDSAIFGSWGQAGWDILIRAGRLLATRLSWLRLGYSRHSLL